MPKAPHAHAESVERLGPDTYLIVDSLGNSTTLHVLDSEFINVARMLGFDRWYDDLDAFLEISLETWTGVLLTWGPPQVDLS